MRLWTLFFLARVILAADGATLYKQICSSCHDDGAGRAPSRGVLRGMTAEHVLAALEFGAMLPMTVRRTAAERRAIAEFVTGKRLAEELPTRPAKAAMCVEASTHVRWADQRGWNGWGVTLANSRFQREPGFPASQIPRLKLKWAFGFPGDVSANAQPSIVAGRVFVGSDSGMVYSLDAATGCIHWFFQAAASVRAAITIARLC